MSESKILYIMVAIGYYTFVLIFSFLAGFWEVLLGTVIVGIISLVWFIYAVSLDDMRIGIKDLVMNIGAYTFGTFMIIFISIQLSEPLVRKEFGLLEFILSIIPIFIWVFLWFDVYRERKIKWDSIYKV